MFTLVELNKLYIDELEKTDFPNPNYRSSKLKAKLEHSDLKNILGFSLLNKGDSTFSTYIVFNSGIDVDTAIRSAYDIGSKDHIIDVAMYLRKKIRNFSSKH